MVGNVGQDTLESQLKRRRRYPPAVAQLVPPQPLLLWTSLVPTLGLYAAVVGGGLLTLYKAVQISCWTVIFVACGCYVASKLWSGRLHQASAQAPRVAVIGGGFSGINLAVQLRKRGYQFKVFEKSEKVGGTWWDNQYPGIACDIFSHLYSLSYALNPNWSRSFAEGPEIQAYLERVAAQFGLLPSDELCLGTELVEARWDQARCQWLVITRPTSPLTDTPATLTEEYFDVLVPCIGLFGKARWPDVKGLNDFECPMVHTREWDKSFDAQGKTVGVIGTGASAVQLVPRLAQQAERLIIFQRSPGWIIPKQDYLHPCWLQWLFQWLPLFMWMHRLYFWLSVELFTTFMFLPPTDAHGRVCWLNRAFGDLLKSYARWQVQRAGGSEDVAEKCMPGGGFGASRPALSLEWFQMLCRPNVELVAAAVEHLESGTVVAGGERYPVDALVCASGFEMLPHPTSRCIFGAQGKALSETYLPSESKYLGMTAPGFPNLFQLYGPGSQGYNNLPTQIEIQGAHVIGVLDAMDRRKFRVAEVAEVKAAEYKAERRRRLKNSIHLTSERTYYLVDNNKGREVWMQHPGNQIEYWWRAGNVDLSAYALTNSRR